MAQVRGEVAPRGRERVQKLGMELSLNKYYSGERGVRNR